MSLQSPLPPQAPPAACCLEDHALRRRPLADQANAARGRGGRQSGAGLASASSCPALPPPPTTLMAEGPPPLADPTGLRKRTAGSQLASDHWGPP